jgi:hypothetical protein
MIYHVYLFIIICSKVLKMQHHSDSVNPRKRAREDFIVSDNVADHLFDANSIRKPSAPSKCNVSIAYLDVCMLFMLSCLFF